MDLLEGQLYGPRQANREPVLQNVIAAAVAAAIITGGAVYIAQMPKPPASEIGRFHFIKGEDSTLWQLDTTTGDVNLCGVFPKTATRGPIQGCIFVDGKLTLPDSEPKANYFDKYDTPAPTPPGENPFAKYHQPPPK